MRAGRQPQIDAESVAWVAYFEHFLLLGAHLRNICKYVVERVGSDGLNRHR